MLDRPPLRRRFASLAATAGAAGFLLLAVPGAVLADCMAPPPIEEAVSTSQVVFVGTVTGVQDQGRRAIVMVEEVWRGPDLPATTMVLGGEGEGFTSVDRTYEVGMKYVFFPRADETGVLRDNLCTNTVQWIPDYEQIRPADARAPIDEGVEGSGGFDMASLVPAGAVVLVVAGVLLVAGLVARGREV